MRVLIINMASATKRMRFMAAQMAHFGFQWEWIEAVTPDTLDPPADDPVWHRWQRPLRVTEMALCASHMKAWERVLELDAPCLILEDDALLASDLPAFLERIAPLPEIDHVSLETRSRKKFVAFHMHPTAPIRRLWQDRTGSAAYIAWPRGAREMLQTARTAGGPSDAIISSTYRMASYQADPALVIQLDQCAAYGVAQPLETASLIDAVQKPPATDKYSEAEQKAFRRRRVLAQLQMGLRQLLRASKGQRMHIRPAVTWPDLRIPPPDGDD